jgi:alkylhydroperoxidase family enzyme
MIMAAASPSTSVQAAGEARPWLAKSGISSDAPWPTHPGTALERHAACLRAASRSGALSLALHHRHHLEALGVEATVIERIVAPEIDDRLPLRTAKALVFADTFESGDTRRIVTAGKVLTAAGVDPADLASLTRSLARIAFLARFPSLTEER